MHIAGLMLPVFAVIVTGWIVGRLAILPRSLADGLVQFAYYVAMPALLFSVVAKEPTAAMFDLRFLASFGGGSLLVWALVGAGSLVLARRGAALATVDGLAAAMTNTGFVALPVLHGMFGQRALLPAAIATLFVAVVMFPLGVILLERSRGAARGAALSPTAILRHTLTNPMVPHGGPNPARARLRRSRPDAAGHGRQLSRGARGSADPLRVVRDRPRPAARRHPPQPLGSRPARRDQAPGPARLGP